jgi:hypothetical protein
MRMKRLATFCSAMPADWMRNTKGPALPSMIGTSVADSSTMALSMPRPAKADIRCSTVATLAPSPRIVVPSVVSPTRMPLAGTSTGGSRSVRRNTMPVLAGAGPSVITTFSPVCSPTPVARIVFFRVRCLSIFPSLRGT